MNLLQHVPNESWQRKTGSRTAPALTRHDMLKPFPSFFGYAAAAREVTAHAGWVIVTGPHEDKTQWTTTIQRSATCRVCNDWGAEEIWEPRGSATVYEHLFDMRSRTGEVMKMIRFRGAC